MTIRTFRMLVAVATLFAAPTLAPAQDAISAPAQKTIGSPRSNMVSSLAVVNSQGQVLRATP
jgi:hypothetical protein